MRYHPTQPKPTELPFEPDHQLPADSANHHLPPLHVPLLRCSQRSSFDHIDTRSAWPSLAGPGSGQEKPATLPAKEPSGATARYPMRLQGSVPRPKGRTPFCPIPPSSLPISGTYAWTSPFLVLLVGQNGGRVETVCLKTRRELQSFAAPLPLLVISFSAVVFPSKREKRARDGFIEHHVR